jgi:hypothetical protein
LVEWKPIDANMGLQRFSGTAAWTIASASAEQLWSTKLSFAGMCTHYYRSRGLGRMIRASTVRRFLFEVFGEI